MVEYIRIEGPAEFCQLYDIQIYSKVNEHGKAIITGIVKGTDVSENNLRNEEITIWGEDQKRPLFSGLVQSFRLIEKGGLWELELVCASFTILLDQCLETRSYQNVSVCYREMLEEARERFNIRSKLVITAREAANLVEKPIIQYQETDWEFLKRMAGRLHTVLMPETTYPMVQMSIGCIQGTKYVTEDEEAYEEELNLDKYRAAQGHKARSHYMSYRMKSQMNYELGDWVLWNGQELCVMEKKLFLKKGMIEWEYVLGLEAGFCLEEQPNVSMRGVSLSGVVIDRKEGMVKVHLDIDLKQDTTKAYWYPYMPITGTILYSIPEKGARVLVNLWDEWGSDGAVTCCVRENGTESVSPERKTFQTDSKSCKMVPEYVGFFSKRMDSLTEAFVVDDEIGLMAYTEKKIRIQAAGNMIVGSDAQIFVRGVTQLKMSHPKAVTEPAWIAMDCGRIREEANTIIYSGKAAEGRKGQNNNRADCLDMAGGVGVSMIPVALKAGKFADSGWKVSEFHGVLNPPYGKVGEGRVIQSQEKVTDVAPAEKYAVIFVGGREYSGYVINGETKIEERFYDYFLRDFFTGVDDSMYRDQRLDEFGNNIFYSDELRFSTMEDLVKKTGYSDFLSVWDHKEYVRVVVCNTAAKEGPYQLVRNGKDVKIKLYSKILAYQCGGDEESNTETEKQKEINEKLSETNIPKVVKPEEIKPEEIIPYKEEKRGWFNRKPDYRGYSFYDFIMGGIGLWEGIYENKSTTVYSKITGSKWYHTRLKPNIVCYDYFGIDGAVNVQIEVVSPTILHPWSNRIYIVDNRKEAFAMEGMEDRYKDEHSDESDDNLFDIDRSENWPSVLRVQERWSIVNIGAMRLFTRGIKEEKNYKYIYNSDRFLHMIAHEFGHVLGLKDAYKRTDLSGWREAKETEEVNYKNMMRSDGEVQSNDIEMILEAWQNNQMQYYASSQYGTKSAVIRLD